MRRLTSASGQIDDGHEVLVLDLGEVTFLDSSGLGLFVEHHKTLRRQGGCVRIANASPRVLTVLAITGLDDVFQLYPAFTLPSRAKRRTSRAGCGWRGERRQQARR